MYQKILCLFFFMNSLLIAPLFSLWRRYESISSSLAVVNNRIDNPYVSPFVKVEYLFDKDPIDVVIPCHEKDRGKLPLVIDSVKKNVIGLRNIIVVSAYPYTDQAAWFNEANFPFNQETIALAVFHENVTAALQYLEHPKSRIGWILQQLLKLYAPLVIPGISSNVLIVDADTIFLRPIQFLDESGAALFNTGSEHHLPYFEHAQKVLPGLRRVFNCYSGISHHMLFQRCIIEDLLTMIENIHGYAAWKVLCHYVQIKESSCMSEYEIYFNFAFLRTDQMKIRRLKWFNGFEQMLDDIEEFRRRNYDYVSFHTYID